MTLQGCLSEVKDFFVRRLYIFGIVAIVIGVIQVWSIYAYELSVMLMFIDTNNDDRCYKSQLMTTEIMLILPWHRVNIQTVMSKKSLVVQFIALASFL